MIFQISDDLFWGYKEDIEIKDFTNSEDIVEVIRCNLEIKLQSMGLEMLCEKLKEKKFHIPKIEEILKNNTNTIYICSHCHNEGCYCN